MKWVWEPMRRYADFAGRSRRREALGFLLFQAIVYVVWFASIFVFAIAAEKNQDSVTGPLTIGIFTIAIFFFWLVTFIPSIAVQVRRFHDQDLSGWFVLLHLIPYIGSFAILVFMFIQGTDGPNRYGPDPRGNNEDHYRRVFGESGPPKPASPATRQVG